MHTTISGKFSINKHGVLDKKKIATISGKSFTGAKIVVHQKFFKSDRSVIIFRNCDFHFHNNIIAELSVGAPIKFDTEIIFIRCRFRNLTNIYLNNANVTFYRCTGPHSSNVNIIASRRKNRVLVRNSDFLGSITPRSVSFVAEMSRIKGLVCYNFDSQSLSLMKVEIGYLRLVNSIIEIFMKKDSTIGSFEKMNSIIVAYFLHNGHKKAITVEDFENDPVFWSSVIVPQAGSFTLYKAVTSTGTRNYTHVLELRVDKDALRIGMESSRKCRVSSAVVVRAYRIMPNHSLDEESDRTMVFSSKADPSFFYMVGERVVSKNATHEECFDKHPFHECSQGIHGFLTIQEAINYSKY